MFEFISERTVTDITYFSSAIFLGLLAARACIRTLTFGIELCIASFQKAKTGGFTPKALGSALVKLITKSFDVAAPALVLAAGVSAVVIEFSMMAFVPNLGLLDVIGAEALAVAIIWRSLEAYVQHVQRAREGLIPAWKPKKKG